MPNLLTQIPFGNLLHLAQNHSRNLLRRESLLLALHIYPDVRLPILVNNLEGEVLHISLDLLVSESPSDKTLGIEDGVFRVGGGLVFSGVTDETFTVGGEGYVGWGDTVSLVVGDDFYSSVFVDSDTTVE